MNRLRDRENVLRITFECQYEGQVPMGSPSWRDLQTRIQTYFEIFHTVTEKLKRQDKVSNE